MDRRQIIKSYFQHQHLERDQIRELYIEPIVEEFGLVSDYIEMIQMFGSIDEVPSEFIEDLGQSLGYEYIQDESSEVQREIIKRILTIYKNRAKRTSLEKTLKYSTDRNWVGEDLTLYRAPLREGYQSISTPRDMIFTHDRSAHDSGHRFMDRFNYNYGVIDFNVQYFDDRTLEMLEMQVPGGVRWNINQLIWLGTGNLVPSYSTEVNETDYVEDITLKNSKIYVPEEMACFDTPVKSGYSIRSGRFVVSSDFEEALNIGGSFISLPTLVGAKQKYRRLGYSITSLTVVGSKSNTVYSAGELGRKYPSRIIGSKRGEVNFEQMPEHIVIHPVAVGDSTVKIIPVSESENVLHKIEVPVRGFSTDISYKGIRCRDKVSSIHDNGKSLDGALDFNIMFRALIGGSQPSSETDLIHDIMDKPIESYSIKKTGYDISTPVGEV